MNFQKKLTFDLFPFPVLKFQDRDCPVRGYIFIENEIQQ